MEELGLRIRIQLTRKRKTQQQIADEIGMSRVGLGNIINGKVMPTLKTIINIANSLDTTVGYLLGETEYEKPGSELEGIKARLERIEITLGRMYGEVI